MTDIIQKLIDQKDYLIDNGLPGASICWEAVKEIERLRGEPSLNDGDSKKEEIKRHLLKDGTPYVRDSEHTCFVYKPGSPLGYCKGDGHHLCLGCEEFTGKVKED